jgi:hypothetical protein
MRCERSLRGRGGVDGVACIAECDEEAIALRVYLSTAVLREHIAKEPPMIC